MDTKVKQEILGEKLFKRITHNPPGFLADCEFHSVRSKEEFLACSKLLHNQYVRKEYMESQDSNLRLDLHQITRRSTTFIALYQKKYILATLTLFEDSPLGVPMDKIYKSELDGLRSKKRRFAEVGMLASNVELMEKLFPDAKKTDQVTMLMHLIREMMQFAYAAGIDSLVACYHPRHGLFYQSLQFDVLAGLKSYEAVKGNPAVAGFLDLTSVCQKKIPLFVDFCYLGSLRAVGTPSYYRFKFSEFFHIFSNLDKAS